MLPAASFAQRRSAIEVGGFGRFTIQPDTLNVENVFGGGGRLGYYIWQGLSVEGEASFGVSDQKRIPAGVPDSLTDVSHTLWQARLLYNTARGEGRTSFIVGAGYVYDGFGRARFVAPRGQGASALVGLRWYLSQRISARFEANGYYIVADDDALPYARKATFTPNFQIGLSGLFRNAPPVPTIVTRFDTVRVTQVRVDTVFRERIAEATPSAGGTGGLARGATVVIGVVNFDFDKYELSSDARRILDDVSASLARPEAANLQLVLTGNTDAIGGESYNSRLGENRAKAVADYLASKGIAANRLTQRSAGETNPVAQNTNPEGRATNRRVLIELQNGAP